VKLKLACLNKFRPRYLDHLRDGLVGGSTADLENKENVAGDAVDVDEYMVRFSCPNLFFPVTSSYHSSCLFAIYINVFVFQTWLISTTFLISPLL
jgi:hypothetical protein